MSALIHMVDVFGSGALSGNPVAVVSNAAHLDTTAMQRLARWLNLSETAFLLPARDPCADYCVRIFTLEREMPFAGHPTLGTCHVWLETGGAPRARSEVIQQCGAGLVRVRRRADRLAFAAPPLIRSGAPSTEEMAVVEKFLGIPRSEIIEAAWVDNGPGWLAVRLRSAAAVLSLEPPRTWSDRIDIGVVGPHTLGSEAAYEVRAFFSDHLGTIVEDPVTGSLNAAIGQWLFASGIERNNYVASQGTRRGRSGRVHVSHGLSGEVWVGGETRTILHGQLEGPVDEM